MLTTPRGILIPSLALTLLAQSSTPGSFLRTWSLLTTLILPLSCTVLLARVPPQTSVWHLRLLPLDVTGPLFLISDLITSLSLLEFLSLLTLTPMSVLHLTTLRKLVGMNTEALSLLFVRTHQITLR